MALVIEGVERPSGARIRRETVVSGEETDVELPIGEYRWTAAGSPQGSSPASTSEAWPLFVGRRYSWNYLPGRVQSFVVDLDGDGCLDSIMNGLGASFAEIRVPRYPSDAGDAGPPGEEVMHAANLIELGGFDYAASAPLRDPENPAAVRIIVTELAGEHRFAVFRSTDLRRGAELCRGRWPVRVVGPVLASGFTSDDLEETVVLAGERGYLVFHGASSCRPRLVGRLGVPGVLGRSQATIADVDGDGRGEIVVAGFEEPDSMLVEVYREDRATRELHPLRTLPLGPARPLSPSAAVWLSSPGDVDGDGFEDIAVVGALAHQERMVSGRLFSTTAGHSGSLMMFPSDFGDAMAPGYVGDVNADGFDDLVVMSRDRACIQHSVGPSTLARRIDCFPADPQSRRRSSGLYQALHGGTVCNAPIATDAGR